MEVMIGNCVVIESARCRVRVVERGLYPAIGRAPASPVDMLPEHIEAMDETAELAQTL